jgi:Zn-dependent protease
LGSFNLESFLIAAPVLLFSIVAHEWAHGWAAYHQGDTSVRVTWDPRPYIDPVGSILVPALTLITGSTPFGWARSWPFDKAKFRNFKRGDIIVSLAGVTMNFLLAVACTLLIIVTGLIGRALPGLTPSVSILQAMLEMGIRLNLILAVLNLLPLPPFDGSHVMKYLLPPAWALAYMRIGAYGFLIFFALITVARPVLQIWMLPAGVLYGIARGVADPFMLAGPWTS